MENLKDLIPIYDDVDDFRSSYLYDMKTVHGKFTFDEYLTELMDIYREKLNHNEREYGITDPRTLEISAILNTVQGELIRLVYAGEFYNSLPNGFIEEVVPKMRKRSVKQVRTTDVNFRFALLQEMGVIKWLETNIQTSNNDRADILQQIMGGSAETIKDYLKGKHINRDVRQKALDFINEKRLPK